MNILEALGDGKTCLHVMSIKETIDWVISKGVLIVGVNSLKFSNLEISMKKFDLHWPRLPAQTFVWFLTLRSYLSIHDSKILPLKCG